MGCLRQIDALGLRSRLRRLELLATGLLLPAGAALGGSVIPMPVQTLADHAGQVIVGRVASVQSNWAAAPRRIESQVIFHEVEYLKGGRLEDGPVFTLIVPGGGLDGFEMRLGCAPEFRPGEKWVLFLLPTYKTFPTVGIGQGALRVIADAEGVERIATHDGRAVLGLNGEGFVDSAGRSSGVNPTTLNPSVVDSLRGADRMRVNEAVDAAAPPLTLSEFRTALRPILQRSRAHPLAGPAGRPDIKPHAAARLRSSAEPKPERDATLRGAAPSSWGASRKAESPR